MRDDLAEIKGITAETALKLEAAGVTSFEGLAAADVGLVAKATGKRHADVERWQAQALELLDAGDAAAGADEVGDGDTGEETGNVDGDDA